MIEYQQVVNYLKKNGYDEQNNISDYWFSNQEKCKKIIDRKFPSHSQIFELQVRWKSAIGEACTEALKNYIEELKEQARSESLKIYGLGEFTYIFTTIDLNKFCFDFNKQSYSIKAVADAFPTSHITGCHHDLRGISLDGIHLTDCKLINLNLSNASFIGANFQQVQLTNCNFGSANFDNSKFILVRLDRKTALGGISLKGAFMSGVKLSDEVISYPMKIKEIRYVEIIKYLLETLVWKKSPVKNYGEWTRFQTIDIRGVKAPVLRHQAEYINWYQSLLGKIDGFYELSMTEKISFIGSIIFTKYWRSATVLAAFSLAINLVFAILYMNVSVHFKGLSGGFLESLYFSVVTFTTLGYGDVTPSDNLGRILVILEVIIGYVALGSFLFILGEKVSQRY